MRYFSVIENNPSCTGKNVTVYDEYTLISVSKTETIIKYNGDSTKPNSWIRASEINLDEYVRRGGERENISNEELPSNIKKR